MAVKKNKAQQEIAHVKILRLALILPSEYYKKASRMVRNGKSPDTIELYFKKKGLIPDEFRFD